MIFFLYGADTLRSKKKLNEISEKFLRDVDPSGMNMVVFESDRLSLEEFHQVSSTAPFLSRRRLVIVKNLLISGKSKSLQSEIIPLLTSGVHPDVILVFWEAGQPKSSDLFSYLKTVPYAEEYALLTGQKLQRWFEDELKKYDLKMESRAAAMMFSKMKNNLELFSLELAKLAAYASGREVMVDDVEMLVHAPEEENVFLFLDALTQRNVKSIYQIMQKQLSAGMNEHVLFSMVVKQVRQLLLVRSEIDRDTKRQPHSSTLAKHLQIHPFVVQKLMNGCKNFSLDRLSLIYKKCLLFDEEIKSGKNDIETVLDIIVYDLVSAS